MFLSHLAPYRPFLLRSTPPPLSFLRFTALLRHVRRRSFSPPSGLFYMCFLQSPQGSVSGRGIFTDVRNLRLSPSKDLSCVSPPLRRQVNSFVCCPLDVSLSSCPPGATAFSLIFTTSRVAFLTITSLFVLDRYLIAAISLLGSSSLPLIPDDIGPPALLCPKNRKPFPQAFLPVWKAFCQMDFLFVPRPTTSFFNFSFSRRLPTKRSLYAPPFPPTTFTWPNLFLPLRSFILDLNQSPLAPRKPLLRSSAAVHFKFFINETFLYEALRLPLVREIERRFSPTLVYF